MKRAGSASSLNSETGRFERSPSPKSTRFYLKQRVIGSASLCELQVLTDIVQLRESQFLKSIEDNVFARQEIPRIEYFIEHFFR